MSASRHRVLLSAYACEPDRGSEPGLGWGIARQVAQVHDVWVLTRENNRGPIEAALSRDPLPNLHPVYFDLPHYLRFWKRGPRGVQLYYALWQRALLPVARRLHRSVDFSLVHHVTFAKCWSSSALVHLGVPFVWGPLGGGDSAPPPFRSDLSALGATQEWGRLLGRNLMALSPALKATARNSDVVLAATEDTARYLERIGARDVRRMPQAALTTEDIERLSSTRVKRENEGIRFICLGNLQYLKGFHLAVRAFARAGLRNGELWVIGDGPERSRLETLAESCGIGSSVRFFGRIPRTQALEHLSASDVCVHPALRDTSPWVCLEAMAAGLPVLALDHSGPRTLVPPAAGILVPCTRPDVAVEAISAAMRCLEGDPELRRRLGAAGRRVVEEHFTWAHRGADLESAYSRIWQRSVPRP